MDWSQVVSGLERQKDMYQGKINDINEAIAAFQKLRGNPMTTPPPPVKVDGRKLRSSNKSQPMPALLKSNEHIKPMSIQSLEANDAKARKAEYQKRWLAKKKAAEGKGPIAAQSTPAPDNRYNIDRPFDLNDKEMSLIRSHLNTWQAHGKVEPTETERLGKFNLRGTAQLRRDEREEIRDVFYSVRNRVIKK